MALDLIPGQRQFGRQRNDGPTGDGSTGGGGTGETPEEFKARDRREKIAGGMSPAQYDAEMAAADAETNRAWAGQRNTSAPTAVATPPPLVQRNNILAPMDQQAQARQRQQALIDQLHGIATGQIKSPAQDLYQQQVQQAQNQNTSNTSSLRDVGAGGQMHIAEQNANTINQEGMQGGALLQSQQKQQAEHALAQLYEQQRQGDLSNADTQSRGALGNNQLNNSRNMSEFDRFYGTTVGDTHRQQDRARADLGYDTDQQAQNASVARDVGEQAGTLFDYLRKQAGSSSQDSGMGYTSDGRPRGYDIRDPGDK